MDLLEEEKVIDLERKRLKYEAPILLKALEKNANGPAVDVIKGKNIREFEAAKQKMTDDQKALENKIENNNV